MTVRYRLGVDVGGTHTDLVLNDIEDGSLRIEKLASSPDNPALAVLEGLARLIEDGVDPAEIGFFAHGTTVTTNALLQNAGARVGLLINDGFGAICEVQTQARDEGNPFDHLFQRPAPITPPSLTRGIGGRIDAAGAELTPLDRDAVRRAAEELAGAGVDSFAVCYLFSFMNDAHENDSAAIIRATVPGALVSRSSQVLPRIREWQRYSTTLVNACLVTVLARYLTDLASGLDQAGVVTSRRFLMQSNGGVMPLAADPESHTVHTLLSGPAAGVQGAGTLLGVGQGWRNMVTLDMGGTSCDMAFIEDGAPVERSEATVAGRLVAVPAVDVTTISAGGGSIARLSAAGLLEVGPKSAGADPGPACYGKGGLLPTVTDADLVCNTLNADYFLGGRMTLDRAAAAAAVERHVAAPLGLETAVAAAGIIRVVNARMADEIRVQVARKGIDLAGFALVPFGGAGPVHAVAVADDLGISRVLVPDSPGAFSALGLLCADVVHDYVRSDLHPLEGLEPDHVEAAFRTLEGRAADELGHEGLGDEAARFVRAADLRYAGQGYELGIPLAGLAAPLDSGAMDALRERFHTHHQAVHGHAARGAAVEVVSYRLRAVVTMPKLDLAPNRALGRAGADDSGGKPVGRRIMVTAAGNTVQAEIWRRGDLPGGAALAGPLIVEQADATTVVPAGWTVTRDGYGNLDLCREANR